VQKRQLVTAIPYGKVYHKLNPPLDEILSIIRKLAIYLSQQWEDWFDVEEISATYVRSKPARARSQQWYKTLGEA
jgi:hypothetical protein